MAVNANKAPMIESSPYIKKGQKKLLVASQIEAVSSGPKRRNMPISGRIVPLILPKK